jgi:UDP-N-acetylglucosamine 4-epimerase
MRSAYSRIPAISDLLSKANDDVWLVTGAAGFIGSNLVEALLANGCRVRALDSLITGHRANLDAVHEIVGDAAWERFEFFESDIRDISACREACKGVTRVLHQAALGSVPRSIEHPEATNDANVGGFVNMLTAAKDAGVRRFVYASSSSVYGDDPTLPKQEERLGKVLSPYALSKLVNEQYAAIFARCYGTESIGLRYFNVFGPRQDPHGAYAAVIPLWYAAMLKGEPIFINGDGETSRDFCYIANVVQANLRSALTDNQEAVNRAYNVACGDRTTLNQLIVRIAESITTVRPDFENKTEIVYRDFRAGDVRHSLADTSLSERLLGYAATHQVGEGLVEAAEYYLKLKS